MRLILNEPLAHPSATPGDDLPTPQRQAAVLTALATTLDPLRRAHKLPPYAIAPGLRLRRLWGKCQFFTDGRPPLILVRCVTFAHEAHGAQAHAAHHHARWRSRDALALTLLHEMAHLRYRSHGPRFWALLRHLVDDAAARGLYDPTQVDPAEQARGDAKLAGSAAAGQAQAALGERRARQSANRGAAARLRVGDTVKLDVQRGQLAGRPLTIVELGPRGGVIVRALDQRHYRVPARLLISTAS